MFSGTETISLVVHKRSRGSDGGPSTLVIHSFLGAQGNILLKYLSNICFSVAWDSNLRSNSLEFYYGSMLSDSSLRLDFLTGLGCQAPDGL